MNPFSKIIPDLLGKVRDVIDSFHTSGEEKMAAQLKLTELEQSYQVRIAEIDAEWAKLQAQVVIAEAQGHSWLQRNWRPLSMLAFVTVILYQYVIATIFSLPTAPVLPDDLWSVIKIGFGGYVIGRSVEKIAPDVAEIVTRKK